MLKQRIKYDEAAISALLNRAQEGQEEEQARENEALNEFFGRFKVAKYGAEAEEEDPEPEPEGVCTLWAC